MRRRCQAAQRPLALNSAAEKILPAMVATFGGGRAAAARSGGPDPSAHRDPRPRDPDAQSGGHGHHRPPDWAATPGLARFLGRILAGYRPPVLF